MIFILPISHENMEAQRFPYITVGIVMLNTLIFVLTNWTVVPRSFMDHAQKEYALVDYYIAHLYLDLPETTQQQLSPQNRQMIAQMKKMGLHEAFEGLGTGAEIANEFMGDDDEANPSESDESGQEREARLRDEAQAELNRLVRIHTSLRLEMMYLAMFQVLVLVHLLNMFAFPKIYWT